MSGTGKAKAEEIIDTTVDSDEAEQSGSDAEIEEAEDALAQAQGSQQPSTSHKKKKKKSKAARALNALRGKEEIPQQLVERVLDQVNKQDNGPIAGADEETVRAALEQLKIMEVMKGNTGLGGINKKDMGPHKFWGTQPVPQPGDEQPAEDGPIEPSKPREEVRQEPYQLPKDFEWSILDLTEEKQIKEVYDLLSLNYIEDDHAAFRFKYSAEFLKWALMPPGYHKEWHVGVRVASNKKLVAFISGVPMNVRIRANTVGAVEINYLCVHKKLRHKRLAPVLIKEVTRQCHLKGIFQALYTAGVVLPTPVSVCRYQHRCLNVQKLVDTKFWFVPRSMTIARMIRLHKLPSKPHLNGLREMEDRDVEAVADLYERYMKRFGIAPDMTVDDIRHHFLSGRGKGAGEPGGELEHKWKGGREGQVVWAFVVENPETHKITDFFSFYSLPSTVINNPKHDLLNAAYLYYYATDVAFQDHAEETGLLKRRVQDLVGDALVVADQAKFDVFNALTLMDTVPVLKELKFGDGDGFLNFYLYNWRTAPLAGMNPTDGVPAGQGVGVVML
ncbi:hypothetical protein HGRIS_012830 [Hohenbuehelia grisea]|uniref:Glycylpeptide N-tetradecanoyltransferase n=1 Tax=Hohenbuehelia grisea TaxID=104357 RepID=A0ABR3ITP3_9AGAR